MHNAISCEWRVSGAGHTRAVLTRCRACARTDPLLEIATLRRLRAEMVDALLVGSLHPLHVE